MIQISTFSFFQTNSLGAEVLYQTAREYIGDLGTANEDGSPDKIVYDLYSGTGTIAQLMAPVAKKVIGVEIPDVAGGLSSVLELMSENSINVEYLYAFITISGQHAYVVLRVEDNDKAAKILVENGVKLVSQADIDAL